MGMNFPLGEGEWLNGWIGQDWINGGRVSIKHIIYSTGHAKHINNHKSTALRGGWGFDW
jgi:hypothetical protein